MLAKNSSSDNDCKWSTLGAAAAKGVANNLTTQAAGTDVLDAYQGKVLSDSLTATGNTINKIESGMAIIVDGDTCTTAVPSGGFAYLKNNTHNLAEGLYKNTSNSAFPTSGGTADSTVFTAASSGGMNELALKSEVESLSDQIASIGNGVDISSHITLETGVYIDSARKYGNVITITGRFSKIVTANSARTLATIASGYRPIQTTSGSVAIASVSDFGYGILTLTLSGELSVIFSKATTYGMYFSITYPVS